MKLKWTSSKYVMNIPDCVIIMWTVGKCIANQWEQKVCTAGMSGVSAKDYGLFLADEDVKKGVWIEPIRNLEYYILRNGVSYVGNWDYSTLKSWVQAGILFTLCCQDLLEYRKKLRTLRVRMLDGTVKTLLVDDSQPVANLMVVICTKIGEYF